MRSIKQILKSAASNFSIILPNGITGQRNERRGRRWVQILSLGRGDPRRRRTHAHDPKTPVANGRRIAPCGIVLLSRGVNLANFAGAGLARKQNLRQNPRWYASAYARSCCRYYRPRRYLHRGLRLAALRRRLPSAVSGGGQRFGDRRLHLFWRLSPDSTVTAEWPIPGPAQRNRAGRNDARSGCASPVTISIASSSPAMRPSVAPLWLKAM